MEATHEALLISAILRNQTPLEAVSQGITPEFLHTYRAEYEWILGFQKQYGSCPSKAAFKTAFKDFTLLATDDLKYAIDETKKNHARISITKSVREVMEFLRDNDPVAAAEQMAIDSRSIYREMASESTSFDFLNDYGDLYDDMVRRMDLADATGITGVATGIPTVDERTSGAQPGDLWLLAARLNRGKTWSLCQMAEGAMVAGRRVLFVSLEQTYRQISHRIQVILSHRFGYGLRHTQLTSGKGLDLHGYKTFMVELPSKVDGALKVVDGSRGRVSALSLAAMIEEFSPDVVYVDYITLMSTIDGRPASDDWRAVASISADVKMTAMQYNIPIIAAAQINRDGEDRENATRPPSVHKLSQSDNLGQDASVVITMRRPSMHTAQYLIDKNRHGERDVVFYTMFDPDKGDFHELTFEEFRQQQLQDDVED